MFTLNETTTVGQFVAELEHFLTFKRSVADNAEELPTKGTLLEYFNKIVGQFDKAFSAPLSNAMLESWGKEAMRNQTLVVDFWGYTMLDVRDFDDCVSLVSLMGDTTATLLTLGMIFDRSEEREYVRHIVLKEGDTPDTPLLDVLVRAALMQDARAPIQDRWLEAPDNFRTRHLICPRCHSGFLELFRGGDYGEKPGHAECHNCGWESKGKYYYRSDLADEKAYRKELKFLRQSEDLKTMLYRAEEYLEAGTERVIMAYKFACTFRGSTQEVTDMLDKYVKLLTNARQEWALAEKNRQGRRKK